MRTFTSYGPVTSRNYHAPRTALIEKCVHQLTGDPNDPEDSEHFFTIWAPRQTGKTWLMRRAVEEIQRRFGE